MGRERAYVLPLKALRFSFQPLLATGVAGRRVRPGLRRFGFSLGGGRCSMGVGAAGGGTGTRQILAHPLLGLEG